MAFRGIEFDLWPGHYSSALWAIVVVHQIGFAGRLYIYHHMVHFKFKKLQKDIYEDTTFKLRLFNEGATLFLSAIIDPAYPAFFIHQKEGLILRTQRFFHSYSQPDHWDWYLGS